jgi:hypothetical protein
MTMRVNTIVTHLRPEDAYTVIDFLDQLRSMLVQTYGDEIKEMLQEALQPKLNGKDKDDLF